QRGLEHGRGVDEVRLVGAPPGGGAVQPRGRQQAGTGQGVQRREGRAHAGGGLAQARAQADAGADRRVHSEAAAVPRRRRRRRRRGAPSRSPSSPPPASRLAARASPELRWASRQNSTSAAWFSEAARRSTRKS